MKHKHDNCTIEVHLKDDELLVKIEGNRVDLVHALAHTMDNDKDFENIMLDTLQMVATRRIVEKVSEIKVEKELHTSKEIKN